MHLWLSKAYRLTQSENNDSQLDIVVTLKDLTAEVGSKLTSH